MKKIIEENYKSTVKRGLISNTTTDTEFILKLEEEVQEFIDAVNFDLPNRNEELADVVLVCLNYAKHNGIDIQVELINKIQKNFKR